MLGVVGDVDPVVALLGIGGIGRVAVLLPLGDEDRLLVELDLPGPRGKKPRARRGPLERAVRPAVQAGSGLAVDADEAAGLPGAVALTGDDRARNGLCPRTGGSRSGVHSRSEKRYLQVLPYSRRM